jgi:hypothetical protein
MSSEEYDFTTFAVEITKDLVAELRSRFPGFKDLSPADRDAIVTAVGKSAWRGILRGVALYTHAFNETVEAEEARDPSLSGLRADVQIKVDGEPDLWAERHGG